MKKLIALILVLVMIFALNSCFLIDSGNGQENKITTTAATTTLPASQNTITRGEISLKVYTSETLNVKFTRPDTWVYATDEEIAALMNLAGDVFDDDRFAAALQSNIATYDMMVIDKLTNSNIILGYENLKKTFSSNITEEQYVETLKQQMATISGMSVTFPDKTQKVKLGETEFTRVICNVVTNGVKMTQVYYLHKLDGYMGFIIVTLNSGYTVEDIEAMFK